jgi:hypothetical protein
MTLPLHRETKSREATERILAAARWLALGAVLLGFLFAHGCHGPHDEDTELRLLERAWTALK